MVEARKVNWQKIILSFLVAAFLFSFGLFLGYLTKGVVMSSTINIEENARNEIVNLETINLMKDELPCDTYVLDLVSEKLDYLGELISVLEIKKGKDNAEVLELKKLYSALEVRHQMLVKERNKICNKNYSIFLFFYSNDDSCKDSIESTSFILSYLRKKYDHVRVYSFDVNLDSDIVKILKNKYNIEGCKAVVYNDKKLDYEITSSQQIEDKLGFV